MSVARPRSTCGAVDDWCGWSFDIRMQEIAMASTRLEAAHTRPIATVAAAVLATTVVLAVTAGGSNDDGLLSLAVGASASASASHSSPSTPSTPTPTEAPTSAPADLTPQGGLTEVDAIATARATSPEAAGWPVLVAKAGSAQELPYDEGGYQVAPGLRGDQLVWVVILGDRRDTLDAEGTLVVIDFLTGEVYEVVKWIS